MLLSSETRARPRRDPRVRGLAFGVAAFLVWALLPIYIKALPGVPAVEILAHRVVWSMALLAAIVTWTGRWAEVRTAFSATRIRPYLASTALISANWLLFIWAVSAGRVLEASLGYFVTPLVTVLLGFLFLRERLSRVQTVAVALAALGVAALVVRLGALPWLSLGLAASFGLYGLVRKKAPIDAVVGLLVETTLLTPIALGYLVVLAARGAGHFGAGAGATALLAAAGVITALPLVWFAIGVRSLRLATMGLLQYLAPTGQFLLAVALYHERFTGAHAFAFACIWASLAIYSWDVFRDRRAAGAAGG